MTRFEGFKCDRCGHVQNGEPATPVHGKDLCDGCQSKLKDFLDGAELDDDP